MAYLDDKFVINKGMNNEFILTIKQNDSTLPMVVELTDTFSVKLYLLETNEEALSVEATIHDAPNGQIKIELTTEQVDSLVGERGPKEDRYYLMPTYRLAIDCQTVNNGNFVAKINEVYVQE